MNTKSILPVDVFAKKDTIFADYLTDGKDRMLDCNLLCSEVGKILQSRWFLNFKKKSKDKRYKYLKKLRKENRHFAGVS